MVVVIALFFGGFSLLGVLIASRSIRLCALLSLVCMLRVSVHDELAYMIVGVTVLSNNLSRDFSGYDLLVSSCRNRLNFRHAAATLLLSSVW